MCGVCPGGGLPRRCRRGGRQRYPAGGVPALSPACSATVVPTGGLPALSPVNPALTCFPAPYPPAPLPGGKGVTIGYFMQGAAPLASPELNPGGTGSPCRCGKLNGGACPSVAGSAGVSSTRRGGLPRRCRRGGRQRYPAGGLAPALPARRASAIPGGRRACFVACLHCL